MVCSHCQFLGNRRVPSRLEGTREEVLLRKKFTPTIGKSPSCTNTVLTRKSKDVCLRENNKGYSAIGMRMHVKAILLPRTLP